MLQLTPKQVQQTAVFAQRLGEKLPPSSPERMRDIMGSIRCLQLDPLRAVERTQFTVLWSRLGDYNRQWLNQLTHEERHLFEYWAHAASIVLCEDYQIHRYLMEKYGTDSKRKLAKWVAQNQNFKRYVLQQLEQQGQLLTKDFEDNADVPWGSSGWTNDRSLPYMLDYLWTKGEIWVSQRDGLKRWWDLAERVRPADVPTDLLDHDEVTRRAAALSLRALGVGRVRDINNHFTRKRYPGLKKLVPELVENGTIIEARVNGFKDEPWFVHKDLAAFVQNPEANGWHARTTLLSPFDNLICDRDRTELIWNFYYRIEIYVPEAKRQYGYYVLPILHGEKLIGRIDSRMDRKTNVYTVNAVYAEPNAPQDEVVGAEIQEAMVDFGRFLGAKKLQFGRKKPTGWRKALQTQRIKG